MISKETKIFIAGHKGMVGSACWEKFKKEGFLNLLGRTSKELDLKNQKEVDLFIKKEKPKIIIDAAAKVGGILANNNYPYEFLLDNMLIQNNLINSANKYNVEKFLFLGSSCIYPKFAPQPIKEESLLTNSLEKTNQWYAIAKISGLKLIEALRIQYNRNYISLMPTNLYGPNDNFNLKSSHVLPALIRKFHEAKLKTKPSVTLWGSGSPLREFLHVDDLASAVFFATIKNLNEGLYNVGSGNEISIKNLAYLIKKIVNYNGSIKWDSSKPDGTPRKLMDSSKIKKLGWNHNINLEEGIIKTYNWYLKKTPNNIEMV